mmetsp:Transcript_2409/g.6410  ORF Transcript_2409/g.6410 Transcript_2409/m.6410 type:complete len:215 (-) Transcript_2409:189-833(-)
MSHGCHELIQRRDEIAFSHVDASHGVTGPIPGRSSPFACDDHVASLHQIVKALLRIAVVVIIIIIIKVHPGVLVGRWHNRLDRREAFQLNGSKSPTTIIRSSHLHVLHGCFENGLVAIIHHHDRRVPACRDGTGNRHRSRWAVRLCWRRMLHAARKPRQNQHRAFGHQLMHDSMRREKQVVLDDQRLHASVPGIRADDVVLDGIDDGTNDVGSG